MSEFTAEQAARIRRSIAEGERHIASGEPLVTLKDVVASDLTSEQAATLARFEAAAPAPESFDATAALRRVLALAARHESCCGTVRVGDLREAIEQP